MKIKDVVVKTGYKALSFGKKHIKEELTILEFMFIGGGLYFTYKGARSIDGKLGDINKEIYELHQNKDYYESAIEEGIEEPDAWSSKEYKAKLTKLYIKKGAKTALTFAPVAGCVVGAVGCSLSKNHLWKEETATLTAAIGALSTRFDNYRDSVREEIGEEKEFDIYHGIKHEKETVVSEKEDGTKKHEKVDSKVIDGQNLSTKIFKLGDKGFGADLDLDEVQIKAYMSWAKQRCNAKGHIQLCEIDEVFGWDEEPDDIVMGYTSADDIEWRTERIRIPVEDPISGVKKYTDGILVDLGKTVNVWKR
jgi:hypothetical protein